MNSYLETEGVISMRQRTVRLDREGDYWTEAEKEKLVQRFREGEGLTAMALEFQRSEPAIIQMVEKLDLYNRRSQPQRRRSAPKPPVCLCESCRVDPACCPNCKHYAATQEEV